mgnify:CR=1 FL=1
MRAAAAAGGQRRASAAARGCTRQAMVYSRSRQAAERVYPVYMRCTQHKSRGLCGWQQQSSSKAAAKQHVGSALTWAAARGTTEQPKTATQIEPHLVGGAQHEEDVCPGDDAHAHALVVHHRHAVEAVLRQQLKGQNREGGSACAPAAERPRQRQRGPQRRLKAAAAAAAAPGPAWAEGGGCRINITTAWARSPPPCTLLHR